MFKLRFIVKHNFCGGRYILSHVLLNNWLALEDNLYIYSSLAPVTSSSLYVGILTVFKPTRCRVDNFHAGETNIILNDSASQMLLYYRLTI